MAKEDIGGPDIRLMSAHAKIERPFLSMSTRWDYLSKYLDLWQIMLQARANMYLLAAVGTLMMFYGIWPLAVVAWAGAAYAYHRFKHLDSVALASSRSILWAR